MPTVDLVCRYCEAHLAEVIVAGGFTYFDDEGYATCRDPKPGAQLGDVMFHRPWGTDE